MHERIRPNRIRLRHGPRASYIYSVTSTPPKSPAADIAYRVVGNGPINLLFIPGMCVSHAMWHNQLHHFSPNPYYTLLLLDNRGAGDSSLPSSPSDNSYSIYTMARDALAIADHVFGKNSLFHVIGHSMGSMIAQRLAILPLAATRLASLALISGHDGGWFWNNIPTSSMILAAIDMLRTGFDEYEAAKVHIRMHYTKPFLDTFTIDDASGNKISRRHMYHQRYLQGIRREKRRDANNHSFWAHLAAVRTHALTIKEARMLRQGEYPKIVLYGKQDPVVLPRASYGLAARLDAHSVALNGSHFAVDECAHDINQLLANHFQTGSFIKEKAVYYQIDRWLPCQDVPPTRSCDDTTQCQSQQMRIKAPQSR